MYYTFVLTEAVNLHNRRQMIRHMLQESGGVQIRPLLYSLSPDAIDKTFFLKKPFNFSIHTCCLVAIREIGCKTIKTLIQKCFILLCSLLNYDLHSRVCTISNQCVKVNMTLHLSSDKNVQECQLPFNFLVNTLYKKTYIIFPSFSPYSRFLFPFLHN